MSFYPPASEQEISTATAVELITNYRKTIPAGSEGQAGIKAAAAGAEAIKKVLEQENCAGIRMYYAIDEKGSKTIVLVGTDADGNDLSEGIKLDRNVICPHQCDNNNSPFNNIKI